MIRVPQDVGTIQEAIGRAGSGDIVLLDRGTYPGKVVVPADRVGITIRGVDRNEVVFDGRDLRAFAVAVHADHVALENFSAHNFRGNAIVWESVHGFLGRYLTVWNVGGYGIYASGSTNGRLSNDLSSGAANSAFYIGECDPCHTVLTHLVARFSGIGYSGTNASGDLVVRDSVWDRNGTGILPNSYNEEANPPQARALFAGNTVRGSGTVPTPATDPLGGFTGIGIGIAGGQRDVVRGNSVVGSARYGIVLYPTLQRGGTTWAPAGNVVRDNTVLRSGVADLAIATGSGEGNCFAGNVAHTLLPPGLGSVFHCGVSAKHSGDSRAAHDLAISSPIAYARAGPRPPYTTMPAPPQQPSLP